MTKHDTAKAQIEAALDAVGWLSFLIALSDVCHEKSVKASDAHDDNLALAWFTRSDLIDDIASPE